VTREERLHGAHQAFLRSFLRPLLKGGAVEVSRPIGPAALDTFALARADDVDVDRVIFDELHGLASSLAPVETLPYPDRGTMALAMAAHNLMLLTDPELDGLFVSRATYREILGWTDRLIGAVDAPSTRGEALARHAVVARVLEVKRKDVVVRTWAYTHRFFGRPLPARVVSWPSVRRVQTEQEWSPLVTLWRESQALDQPLWSWAEKLIERSPVTYLTRPELFDRMRLGEACLSVLLDASVRYGVAFELAKARPATVAAQLGGAMVSLYEEGATESVLKPLGLLTMEVGAMWAHDGVHEFHELGWRGDGARFFAAAFSALVEASPLVVRGLAPPERERLRVLAGTMRDIAGTQALESATNILAPPGERERTSGAMEAHQ
jgi:hypothetical protein